MVVSGVDRLEPYLAVRLVSLLDQSGMRCFVIDDPELPFDFGEVLVV